MSALTTHLRETGDHGRLPFRRDCPVCRAERLAGTLPDAAIVSPRVQAALLATVIGVATPPGAVSALAAAPVIEQRDEPRPPAGAPETEGGEDPAGSGERRRGVEEESAPRRPWSEADLPGTGEDHGADPASIEKPSPIPPPSREPERPPGEPGGAEAEAPSREAERPIAPGGGEEPPATGTAPEAPRGGEQPAPGLRESLFTVEAGREGERSRVRSSDPALPAVAPRLPARERRVLETERRLSAEHGKPPTLAEVASASGLEVAEVAGARRAIRKELRKERRAEVIHVVGPGDCLWTIAAERLGGEPSDAEVARAVARLWERNERRIASGDPDLIMPGERLRVRRDG